MFSWLSFFAPFVRDVCRAASEACFSIAGLRLIHGVFVFLLVSCAASKSWSAFCSRTRALTSASRAGFAALILCCILAAASVATNVHRAVEHTSFPEAWAKAGSP